ncbi:MAG TPA: sterol desaturase family protein [Hyphomicrobiaceae bacterium]|nr:sterol desaturase family protein [Hyphomicrobiaceae bacterium]
MVSYLVGVVIAFLVLLAVFGTLDLFRPAERRLGVFRPGFRTDLAYWFFTSIVGEAIRRAALVVIVALITYGVWQRIDHDLIMQGFGPLSRLPYAIQVVLMLLIGDFLGYWMHRFFHRGNAWRFHAVHHSSEALDWLSSVRVHPLNEAAMTIATFTPLLLLGFAPAAAIGVAPVVTLFAILVHANVDWDWGPFRKVLVSPRFHRWHHSDEADAIGKNFAGLFPVWDILFGTYFMPAGRAPRSFGAGTPVPEGLWAQMKFPLSRS